MNRKDDYIYKEHCSLEFRKAGLEETSLEQEVTAEDFIPEAPCGIFRDLKGEDVFDLGGTHIEIYDCPGHTLGTVVMLITEERSVLLGDTCNYFTFMFDNYSTTVTEYEENLKKLSGELAGKFDTVYFSHGGGRADSGLNTKVKRETKTAAGGIYHPAAAIFKQRMSRGTQHPLFPYIQI